MLELVASESPSEDLVLADLVLAEGPVVLGRVIYGSFEMLEQVLKMTSGSVSLFLNDKDGGAWAADWPASVSLIVGAERILPMRSKRLFAGYLEDVVNAAAARCGDFCIMIYGSPSIGFVEALLREFQ